MPLEQSTLRFDSKWGVAVSYEYVHNTDEPERLVVILPGQGYALDAPLLWYTTRVAVASGCDVLGVEYGFWASQARFETKDFPSLVEEVSNSLRHFVMEHDYADIVFVGKSLGTLVACELSGQFNPSALVFLTPLSRTIPFLRQSKSAFVAVGTRDPLFLEQDVAQIRDIAHLQLHVYEGADHLLEIMGDVPSSLGILSDVALRLSSFLEDI